MTNGLNYELIKSAVAGDTVSINTIVSIYEPYINTLASRRMFDEEGIEYYGIDVNLKDQLVTKLINTVLKYNVI